MFDARRMEVYSQLFNSNFEEARQTEAQIIDEQAFIEELRDNKILFFGDGMNKTRPILEKNSNAFFLDNIFPLTPPGELQKFYLQEWNNNISNPSLLIRKQLLSNLFLCQCC